MRTLGVPQHLPDDVKVATVRLMAAPAAPSPEAVAGDYDRTWRTPPCPKKTTAQSSSGRQDRNRKPERPIDKKKAASPKARGFFFQYAAAQREVIADTAELPVADAVIWLPVVRSVLLPTAPDTPTPKFTLVTVAVTAPVLTW